MADEEIKQPNTIAEFQAICEKYYERGKYAGSLDRFQESVGVWGQATFPRSSIHSIAQHFREEADEFHAAISSCVPTLDHADEEAADCVLLLLHYCYRRNVSLMDLMQKKMETNRVRKWADVEGRGYAKHVCDCCGKNPCVCPIEENDYK